MTVTVRPATAADLDAFYPHDKNRPSMTAVVGEVDGKLIACGGFAHVGGILMSFVDLKPEARRYRVTIVKTARRLIAEMGRRGKMIYADLDPREPHAERWLTSLGFTMIDDRKGRMRWQDSQR